jgi:hypothetical protein
MLLGNRAFARPGIDVIIMKNGDRITCEIKELNAGILKVDVPYMNGAVYVDWNKLARIESTYLFLVQLRDGTIHSGKLVSPEVSAAETAKLEIQTDQPQPVVVDASDVVRISQTSEELAKRFNGSLTLGTQYSKGNNTTQYSIASDLGYQTADWGSRLAYNSSLSSSTGVERSTRNQVDLFAYRFLPWKNWFYAGTGGFLQSSVQGINRQYSIGMGIGRYLKNSNLVRLSVMAGGGWQGTNYVPSAAAGRTQDLAVGLLVANLELFSFKKTNLDVNASLAPALTEGSRYFSRVNVAYYLKIFGKIDWNISFYGSWDTNPPAQLQSSDYGTSTGLSYTFGR